MSTTTLVSKKGVASIRIDLALLDDLKAKAKAENRSLSNYIETLLRRFGFGKEEEYVDEYLMKDIARVRREYEEGNGVLCRTKEETLRYLDSL